MEEVHNQMKEFAYKFVSNGRKYVLKVPLEVLRKGSSKELSVRLIKAHKIPFHLEDELHEKLKSFTNVATLEMLDQQTENLMYGGSVFEKGSDTDQSIRAWTQKFSENCVQYCTQTQNASCSNETSFSVVYHNLIHSPALETLLQLEHTYAMAVSEVIKAWENAQEIISKRQEVDLECAMEDLGRGRSEHDISMLTREHMLEKEACLERWSQELSQLRHTQKTEYRDWVTRGYEQMHDNKDTQKGDALLMPPTFRSFELSTSPSSSDGLLHSIRDPSPLEESFTINLGSQKKSTHNVRVMRGDPLSLCKHKTAGCVGDVGPNPERLQTAMSLYSDKLSALVITVDGRINSHGSSGLKDAFTRVCHQSTDFHFHDIDTQISKIQECALTRNAEHKDVELSTSVCSTPSEEIFLRDSAIVQNSDPTNAPCTVPGLVVNGGETTAGAGVWSTDMPEGQDAAACRMSPLENKSVSLEQGDFYVTKHSNLSQVHLVFHLVVTDDKAVLSHSLKSRHPIMAGLKNCLRFATMHEVHHITIPLLLVHTMQPEMTISWCMKRAELVFKCVKGFMLENTAWTESDSRTIQFLVPSGLSNEVFEEFCDMLPKLFRVTSTRNLTSRTRNYSYK